MRSARTSAVALLDALLPANCAGCERPGPVLCEACAVPLHRPARPAWPRPTPPGLPPPYAAAAYDAAVRRALIAYKEHGAIALTEPLAGALAASITAVLTATAAGRSGVALVPVPSARQRRRQRGDDVVARLARRAATGLRGGFDVPRVVPALRLIRSVADSSGLSAPARRANLAGAVALRAAALPRLQGRAVVLVDDLITTGATLCEAAEALRGCEVEPIGAAVVAATARRSVAPPG